MAQDATTSTSASSVALRRVALEACRGAAIACHAAASLCRDAHLGQPAMRAARCAEGLLRSVVALAAAPPVLKPDTETFSEKKSKNVHKDKGTKDKDKAKDKGTDADADVGMGTAQAAPRSRAARRRSARRDSSRTVEQLDVPEDFLDSWADTVSVMPTAPIVAPPKPFLIPFEFGGGPTAAPAPARKRPAESSLDSPSGSEPLPADMVLAVQDVPVCNAATAVVGLAPVEMAFAAASTARSFISAASTLVPVDIPWKPHPGASAQLFGLTDNLNGRPVKVVSGSADGSMWLCAEVFGPATVNVPPANLRPFGGG